METQKVLPLAKEHKQIVSLLGKEFEYDYILLNDPEHAKRESENWTRWTQERVDSTVNGADCCHHQATVASLQQLKSQAEQKMVVSDGPAREVSTNIKLSLDDGLQSLNFSSQKDEQAIVQDKTLQAKIDTKLKEKLARLRAEAIKKEEMKKRSQME